MICTTSNRPMLNEMELSEVFDAQIRVPAISSLQALDKVLREVELFTSEQEHRRCLETLQQAGLGQTGKMNVGVKKLLNLVEMARQDQDKVDTFVQNLLDFMA